MPELPDIQLYLHALRPRVAGRHVTRVRIVSPFVLRTFDPPVEALEGQPIEQVDRIGKRILFGFPDKLYLIVHLMIAGRFRWFDESAKKPPGKIGLASIEFEHGTLHLVESSPKKRASMHVVRGKSNLEAHDPGGTNPLTCDVATFAQRLRLGNHTLKRALTNPRLFDGIGNAYLDEILHAARLSPVKLTSRLTDAEISRLFDATRLTLTTWIERLRAQFANSFPGPGDVTAFRPEFAVHGKFGQPCPVCRTSVQRIRYADNETNYCPRCQTDGRLLADRSLSRLLKNDWPKTVEEWEAGTG